MYNVWGEGGGVTHCGNGKLGPKKIGKRKLGPKNLGKQKFNYMYLESGNFALKMRKVDIFDLHNLGKRKFNPKNLESGNVQTCKKTKL